ncbi:2-(1,2-epoxy-1,2-dihydrophenyl)acetyl-CoA isomerase PaaG [Bordetella holmesii]|uniref:Phenylacetate degradation enoyl-CoA hydratase PaaB n=2 Tax=Bordetella holmesii TaxID=35814 RepID=A0A158LYD0_9BORD|nr:2-(1,2-epoxy-1,2-dihydrophenyl)acetyl-CoA isomerase PaaG [Bordetella holmesii]AHV92674.1 phenylacetate degradation putative enoyl-CoA hydratase PaaB [Bordetella holmesii ATCC 51541]EWM43424.1 phenylacetate degradation putative enoyl-CoA hydratase PaaB [Bordetella holmesii 41130]EWM47755.1 phenylacetate degradation putative enoyl-CoA hydratase PaaB [Bordetella holmesii 35009]EWM51926.1 phenylacetate degradation putative enoyl-CoA hydratase PaaB [Bordetella holmesii 70147]AMD46049.1 enoyl-CoA
MSYQDIEFSLADGIARLTLNRPDKLNSFTARMHGEVADALTQVETQGARVVVLTGAGRGFCAGQDLSERRPTADGSPPDLGETVEKFYAPLVRRLAALPLPVVVGVNGVAAGAGANLAFAGDIVIAKESASFIQSFCRLGLIPDTGGTFVLPRLVGRARAFGLAMLGDKIAARQAQDLGLIWQCVADEAFEETLEKMARHFARAPTKGLAFSKRALQASLGNDLATQLDLERDMMRELGRSADYAEGVAAFLDKREPDFKGQ